VVKKPLRAVLASASAGTSAKMWVGLVAAEGLRFQNLRDRRPAIFAPPRTISADRFPISR